LIADDAATFDEALALCRSGRLGDARRILEDYAARRPSGIALFSSTPCVTRAFCNCYHWPTSVSTP
jgi:hypothetical protein